VIKCNRCGKEEHFLMFMLSPWIGKRPTKNELDKFRYCICPPPSHSAKHLNAEFDDLMKKL